MLAGFLSGPSPRLIEGFSGPLLVPLMWPYDSNMWPMKMAGERVRVWIASREGWTSARTPADGVQPTLSPVQARQRLLLLASDIVSGI